MDWNLTKPALLYGNQPPQFFNSTPDALSAAMAQLPNQDPSVTTAPPTSVSIAPALPNSPGESYGVMQGDQNAVDPNGFRRVDPRSQAQIGADAQASAPQPGAPQLSVSGGGPQLSSPTPSGLPIFHKPTFQEATTDQYGNARPGGPALTKLGLLANILKSAEQGGSDALSAGALNAAPGKSGFGSGWAGAVQMPYQRAQMKQAEQHGALENQQLQMQTQYMPQILAQNFAKTQADINAKKYTPLRGSAGGAIENATGDIVAQNVRQQFESLQQALTAQVLEDQHAGLDPMAEPKASQLRDQITSLQRDGAVNDYSDWKKQNPNGTVEDWIKISKVQPKIDIHNATAPSTNPVMERKQAQVELDSTNALTAHNKEISARVSKLDPADPAYANQMAQVERDDYAGKSQLARGYAKARTAMGLPTQPPTFDPWTNSYLTDDERAKLLAGSTSPAKSSGLPPWVKKGSTSTNHLPGNPYAQ